MSIVEEYRLHVGDVLYTQIDSLSADHYCLQMLDEWEKNAYICYTNTTGNTTALLASLISYGGGYSYS